MWEFVSYYYMSELVTECGGVIGTDGQVQNKLTSIWKRYKRKARMQVIDFILVTPGFQHGTIIRIR